VTASRGSCPDQSYRLVVASSIPLISDAPLFGILAAAVLAACGRAVMGARTRADSGTHMKVARDDPGRP
jgi:hypothetical protein